MSNENKMGGKSVAMMRCAYDPMLGAKPRQAFTFPDAGMTARINDEASGVIVTMANGTRHFVFGANIQSIRLEAEEPKVKKA